MLAGELRLPDVATRAMEIKEHRRRQANTYVGSERYTLEVDYRTYSQQLERDIRRGAGGS